MISPGGMGYGQCCRPSPLCCSRGRDKGGNEVFNLSPMEMGVVLLIALLVLGPAKLPQLGKSLGRTISEFQSAVQERFPKEE